MNKIITALLLALGIAFTAASPSHADSAEVSDSETPNVVCDAETGVGCESPAPCVPTSAEGPALPESEQVICEQLGDQGAYITALYQRAEAADVTANQYRVAYLEQAAANKKLRERNARLVRKTERQAATIKRLRQQLAALR